MNVLFVYFRIMYNCVCVCGLVPSQASCVPPQLVMFHKHVTSYPPDVSQGFERHESCDMRLTSSILSFIYYCSQLFIAHFCIHKYVAYVVLHKYKYVVIYSIY